MVERPRRFVFSFRLTGSDAIASPRERREELERRELLDIEGRLPPDNDSLNVRSRRLDPEALAAYLDPVSLVEADFLGPVCAGIEVTLCHGNALVDIDRAVMAALADTAWACGGPVIRVHDRAVRHPIDLVTFAAEALAEPPCFGQDVLLRLPHCRAYEAHVRAAVRATLEQAGTNVGYLYSTGRKDHVKLCFDRYPERRQATLWQKLFARRPSAAESLRGYAFRAIAYVKPLADDRPFWGPADEGRPRAP